MSVTKKFFHSLGALLIKLMQWIEKGQSKASDCKG